MSRIFRRVTGIFKKKAGPVVDRPRRASPIPTPNPYSRRPPGRNTSMSPEPVDNETDDDDGSIIDDYSSSPARTRRPAREMEPPIRDNTPLRSVSSRIPPTLPNNTSTNIDPTPVPPLSRPSPVDPPSNTGQQPSLDGQRTEISPHQPSLPSATRIPTIPVRRSLTPLMALPRRPLQISPHSTLIGFPSDLNPRPATFPPRPYQSFLSSRPPQQRPSADYAYDYPVENVVIDGDIPSSMATRINRAVDQDRFSRRAVSHSHANAVRHIREIPLENTHYPPLIINQAPPMDCSYRYDPTEFPRPFHHFVACAAPNDPMRNY